MEFAEIKTDPFTNTTNNFFLVLEIAQYNTPNPGTPGQGNQSNGMLSDPQGNIVGMKWIPFYQDYEVTGNLSNEAYAHSWTHDRHFMLIPPNFKYRSFSIMIGFWLTPEEVKEFILHGGFATQGGD